VHALKDACHALSLAQAVAQRPVQALVDIFCFRACKLWLLLLGLTTTTKGWSA
jgi:hypothetical protein